MIGSCLFWDGLHSVDCIESVNGVFKDPWTVQVGGGYAFGKFMGFKKNYADLDLFVAPSRQGDWQTFAELEGFRFGHDKWGVTGGVGARRWNSEKYRALGANVYYDYREGAFSPFHRIGVGLESLGQFWDLRLNTYFLLDGSKKQGSLQVYHHLAGYLETCRENEYGFGGFDAEAGIPLWGGCHSFVYNALGAYYFRSIHENFFGGYFRLQCDIMEYLRLEARVSYDEKNRTQVQGLASISFPLYSLWSRGCAMPVCGSTRMLTQPVYRNPMIVTKRGCKHTQNW